MREDQNNRNMGGWFQEYYANEASVSCETLCSVLGVIGNGNSVIIIAPKECLTLSSSMLQLRYSSRSIVDVG